MADMQANTPDPLYDLVGTLYHALKQAAAAERHAADAQRGRDTELATLFQDVREQSLDLAAGCKTPSPGDWEAPPTATRVAWKRPARRASPPATRRRTEVASSGPHPPLPGGRGLAGCGGCSSPRR